MGVADMAVLSAFNAYQQQARIGACRDFLNSAFATPKDAFQKLFDDQGEALKEAEEFEPRIEWEQATLSRYCGRKWMQRLLNTLNDERGRNAEATDGGHGAWLHLFPLLTGQPEAMDFKEVTDAAQSGLARTA